MKKAFLVLLSVIIMFSAAACGSKTESGGNSVSSGSTSAIITQTPEPIKLVNKMTEKERSRVNKHALTLPDEPTDIENTEHKVSIEFITQTPEDLLAALEAMRDEISVEQYEEALEGINSMTGSYTYAAYALIDGVYCLDEILIWTPENDENGWSFTVGQYNVETDEYEDETVSFETFEEYLDWAAEDYKKSGFSENVIKSKLR